MSKAMIACVTGATGMVGKKIVKYLIDNGHTVRVLTRDRNYRSSSVQVYTGTLDDQETLAAFVTSADWIFHCAAELHDESRMQDVNVRGTQNLVDACLTQRIGYFCLISSAGVVGPADVSLVDEQTKCSPNNAYERTKYEAELIVMQAVPGVSTVALRPTNVISYDRPGAFLLPIRAGFLDRVKVFFKGGEHAHLVHSDDVARAALFLATVRADCAECYFVADDEDPANTFAGIWALYKQVATKSRAGRAPLHLPAICVQVVRGIIKGRWELSTVRYSSNKLRSRGFTPQLTLSNIASVIADNHNA